MENKRERGVQKGNPLESTQTESRQEKVYANSYLIYLGLTTGLFLFLVFMAWLAIKLDWIPK